MELVLALLRGRCESSAEAEAVLTEARRLGVDALDYCSHRCGLDATEVLRRGAAWAGLAFSPVVPSTGGANLEVRRLDSFATTRTIRERLFDREVIYLAPGFAELVRLKAHFETHPALARTTCVAPASAIRVALAELSAPQLLHEARQRLSRRWPHASAHLDLGRKMRVGFTVVVLGLTGLAALSPLVLQGVLLPLVAIVLMVPALFKVWAVLTVRRAARAPAVPLADAELPVYSVLVPLRDEAHMVPLLLRALSGLDYPPEKLDIKFVVEARSASTIAAVEALLADPRFELVVVPDAPPATKPKALDYALPFVRGRLLVVYDAEDIPNPDQLRLAAAAFAADPGVDCLQAELQVDNARESPLTGLFAGEYAAQFGVVMPALIRWGLPIPLGGTSNHFRTPALREMGGWDAFNVTEDADLGTRLARLRYRTEMLFSQTYEEAPVSLSMWMRQRTRWMKGWMQTFIVHNRNPVRLFRDLGWRGFLGFEIHVGSLILSPLLHTAFVIGLLVSLVRPGGVSLAPTGWQSFWWIGILVIGYGGSFAVVVAGLLRLGQKRLLPLQLLLPGYWILHAAATIRASVELVTHPHFWAKTTHGVTRLERSFNAAPAPVDEVGRNVVREELERLHLRRGGIGPPP